MAGTTDRKLPHAPKSEMVWLQTMLSQMIGLEIASYAVQFTFCRLQELKSASS
jgi:hypothetical protein